MPIHLIRAEEQIGGSTIELGGAKSFDGVTAGRVVLNESVLGAGDAGLVVQGDAHVTGTLLVNGSPVVGDKNFVFNQISPLSSWTINHNMGKKPSVAIVTTGGDAVTADVNYIDNNNLTVTFSTAFAGTAYLN